MSAPSLDDPPTMPTMVSRLPKFGFRTKPVTPSGGTQTSPTANTSCTSSGARLTNGFYHHPGPAGVNGAYPAPHASVKQNGFIRVPVSFSMKWRKESEEDGAAELKRENRPADPSQRQGSPVTSQRDKKPTTTSAGKGLGFGHPVTSSSSLQSNPRTLPVSKCVSKPSQTAAGLTNGTKPATNGLPGSKPWGGTTGSLRKPLSYARVGGSRPGSGLGSRSGSLLQRKAQACRSQSSDNLGSAPPVQLTESDRFRSRSLTQVRQQASPTLTPSSSLSRTASRSYSVNRAAGRGLKELTASSAQVSARGKSPVSSQTPEGGGRGVRVQSSALQGRPVVSSPSLLPPSALKKPLLPSLVPASKHSGISYKLSRPSLNKQSRPLRVTPGSVSEGDPEVRAGLTARGTSVENSPEMTPESPEREGRTAEPVSQGEVSIVVETLEDMSLSSNSSLDRNDTSEEYMDDFDNLGNGGVGLLLLSSKNEEDDSGLDQSCARFDEEKAAVGGVAKAAGLCFLDDGMEWADMRLGGERQDHQLTRLPHRRRSSQPDYHDQGGSSLDLSPSDSCGSGGTYMWDEEGLEPLGGAATTPSSNATHHIGSFDSDLNSIDLLNNLDSCDLDDDDLMLDADGSEDASLHSDGDGVSHMAQWRRRQLCWGTQDVHNDTESDFQTYDLTEDPGNQRKDTTRDSDLLLDLCPPRSPGLPPGAPSAPSAPGLGVDVEELAEDCSAVRSQLEHLQRLLLQEEDVDEDTLSPEASDSSRSSDTQVQALLQEVLQLREELRGRDRTIAQLSRQLTAPTVTARCRCQETKGRTDRQTQTGVTERESVASQTPWREHAALPPAPFLSPPWQYQRSRPYRGRPRPAIPSHLARKRVEKLVLYFSDTACHRYFSPPASRTRTH